MTNMGKKKKSAVESLSDHEEDQGPSEASSRPATAGELGGKKKLSNKERRALQKKAASEQLDAAVRACNVSEIEVTSASGRGYTNGQDVKVDSFSIGTRGKELFRDASFTLVKGHRYGLCGENGCGKSTLLRFIYEKKIPVPNNLDVLYVEQEIDGSDKSALQAVMDVDTVRTNLLNEKKELEDADAAAALAAEKGEDEPTAVAMARVERLREVEEELDMIKAEAAEGRARKILSGLGFSEAMMAKTTQEFSGGWRMRIALARALFMAPTLLMLDEPTNHLDLASVIWLDDFLQSWKKMLVVISHDREFLNNTCTDILHVYRQKLALYRGTYDDFEVEWAEKKRIDDKNVVKAEKQAKAAHAQKGSQKGKDQHDKKRGKGRKGSDADEDDSAGPSQQLEKHHDYVVRFQLPQPGREVPGNVIEADKVSFQYPGQNKPMFENLDFAFSMRTRIAICGPNGSGKSTLLRLLAGDLEPTSGQVLRNAHVRVGRYHQHFVDQLPLDKTPVQCLQEAFPEEKQGNIQGWLGRYGLPTICHHIANAKLSGGQKARVAFTMLTLLKPHVVILDEATNHLDMESVDALRTALSTYEGGLCLVSHDARIIRDTNCELWLCDNGKIVRLHGGYEEYKSMILSGSSNS